MRPRKPGRTTEPRPQRRAEPSPPLPRGPSPAAIRTPRHGICLYGRHPVRAALANPRRKPLALYATQEGLAALEGIAHPDPVMVDAKAMERDICPPGAVHQGLALWTDPLPPASVDDLLAAAPARLVVLDQVTDPQNVGAVLRSAAAFGAGGVIMQDRHSPPESGALAKASAGLLERVPVARVPNLTQAVQRLQKEGYWVVGLDADAKSGLDELPGLARLVLVLGAEGAGLRRLVREACDQIAGLPMADGVDSLNVSAAAAVALYAARRA